ncbi:hypothetical protein GS424_012920 [Eggerthella guodeyinii]|uniref:Uncharacterized protein n=1 Tax=Eggerthella guodeyinii TaxID=2690837 RepID=A0A6L7ITD2_9ACTN|nr:hypothetical protein [Eggerthella guodeyinii]QOS67414.1 hypothetical protein GS424_012920 [Eggerthella guodeyinii]
MSGTGKRDVERLLRAHYRAERGAPDAASKAATLAAVRAAVASGRPAGARMGAEAAAGACAGERGRRATFAGFVAAQARFIHPRVLVAQLALVAMMVAVCLPSSGMVRGFSVVSGMLAAATVLVGLPDLLASATHRVAELEYACRFDCRAVALARLIVLGCSDVVAVTAIALAAPIALGADPFASFLHACVPYFLSCAGALLAARRCPPSQALLLACVWTLLVMAGAYAVHSLAPGAYAQASVWLWALVAAASLGWAVREVRTWLGSIAAGLDVFAPAPTPR